MEFATSSTLLSCSGNGEEWILISSFLSLLKFQEFKASSNSIALFLCTNTERQVVGNNRDVSWFLRMKNDLKF